MVLLLLDDLVEVNRVKSFGRKAEDAANFRARLLGLMYEDLLECWFKAKDFSSSRKIVGVELTTVKSSL